jgi:cation diffusion facilitator family transporter
VNAHGGSRSDDEHDASEARLYRDADPGHVHDAEGSGGAELGVHDSSESSAHDHDPAGIGSVGTAHDHGHGSDGIDDAEHGHDDDGEGDHGAQHHHEQGAEGTEHGHGGHDHDSDEQSGHGPGRGGHDHGGHAQSAHEHGAHEHGGHEHGDEDKTLWTELRHLVQPHSHDAADSVDSALEASADGIRAVRWSLVGLGITAVLQLVVAITSGSVAVLADTIHNFADASTAVPLWLAFWIGRKPANTRYTYGYGRAEDLAGVFVLLMIVVSAGVAFWESLQKLLQPTPIQHLGWVAGAGLLGFIGNEAVAQYRIRVGERIGSAALIADGYHARTDGLTSLAVLVGAAGVWLGFGLADPLVGLLITVAILFVLKDAALQMWRRLMDAVDPILVEQASLAASQADGVQSVSAVRARWIGHAIHAEALIVADADLSLGEAHQVAERARHNMLHAVPRLNTVTVHVDPCAHDGRDHHADVAHHDTAESR